MGTRLFSVSITEVKGDKKKKTLRLRNKLERFELAHMLSDILVCDFQIKRNLYDECNIEIGKSMNDK